MSRLAKKPMALPAGVTATLADNTITVKGPLGELKQTFIHKEVSVETNTEGVVFTLAKNTVFGRALLGTYAALVRNMIEGVTKGYTKKLILDGIGYKVNVVGKNVDMALGFSHPVSVAIPAGITATTEKNNLTITGIDKELVGQFTASIRSLKKPEPYKGKGFRYDGEIIRRKQGKKNV